ncbi:MAG TPA: redoxin domain-containing protein [Methylomirabilota bacterium]|jgi:peroxiredoxin|nr:redoxin domain-containing protein [Methylomirabilota bacterium]
MLSLILAGPATALEVGQRAPDFTLAAPGGKLVTLADLLAKGPVILYTFLDAANKTCIDEIGGFQKHLAQFEAAGVQIVGVSSDHVANLDAFIRANKITHLLLSDYRRRMLPAYGALVTDDRSLIAQEGKRSYFIIDRQGIIRYLKTEDNALERLKPEELLRAFKESGA